MGPPLRTARPDTHRARSAALPRGLTGARSAATLTGGRHEPERGAEEDSGILTASEFAFLAIGLVLGVASGAALIEVLRARPPASREIRVTVAPNAIQRRLSATLAEASMAGEPAGPPRFGPRDRRVIATPPGEPLGRAPRGREPGPPAPPTAPR